MEETTGWARMQACAASPPTPAQQERQSRCSTVTVLPTQERTPTCCSQTIAFPAALECSATPHQTQMRSRAHHRHRPTPKTALPAPTAALLAPKTSRAASTAPSARIRTWMGSLSAFLVQQTPLLLLLAPPAARAAGMDTRCRRLAATCATRARLDGTGTQHHQKSAWSAHQEPHPAKVGVVVWFWLLGPAAAYKLLHLT